MNNFESEQLQKLGLQDADFITLPVSKEDFFQQLSLFEEGIPPIKLAAPAIPGEGIMALDDDYVNHLVNRCNDAVLSGRVSVFIPASGAASRLFNKLSSFLNTCPEFDKSLLNKLVDEGDLFAASVKTFLENIESFAFSAPLLKEWNNSKIGDRTGEESYQTSGFLSFVLNSYKFNLLSRPKALFDFHVYENEIRTCFEEHLKEGIQYIKDENDVARFHFTVSQEHLELFEELYDELIGKYRQENVVFDLGFSVQKKSTDTVALTPEGKVARTADGKLLFRPGGHGALLENLNDLDGDYIVIKNVDNISPDRLKPVNINYKKALLGLISEVEEEVHKYLSLLEKGEVEEELLNEIQAFAEYSLNFKLPDGFADKDKDYRLGYLYGKLNRPVRICGMVKNEGHVGGGPYWVEDRDGNTALQIIESAQIDKSSEKQTMIMENATHFNPVDLVCSVRDYKGDKFDLPGFRDDSMAFISKKSYQGNDIIALELPGLWNGGMADWNTLFVEVPAETFNPVKEVNDLLKDSHKEKV